MTETTKTTFELINELIVAISNILWPILVFVFVFLFKKEISGLFKRIKKGTLFGQDFELEEGISEFQKVTKEAASNIPSNQKDFNNEKDEKIDELLNKALEDPLIGILILSREIEIELTKLTASMGLFKDSNNIPIHQIFELLEERNYVTKSTLNSVKIFWDLRNQIIHGKHFDDKRDLVRVLDTGVTLLNTIKAVPHAKNVVHATNIDLFSDSNCQSKRPEVTGVILEYISSGGIDKSKRIFPTLKKDYIKGTEVSWEWSFDRVWDKTYYKDPDDNLQIKTAWNSSAHFIGRPIKEV